MRVAILISGTGSNMAALLDDMGPDHPGTPALVVSNVPGAAGLERAAARGVETAVVDHKEHPDRAGFETVLQAVLTAHRVDLIALAGFMRILTPAFVSDWAGRILNIHPSLLPKYPGLHTHARALEAGDRDAGATVHEVTADLDAGPILGQIRVPIAPDDTPEALAARVQTAEHILYPAVLRRFLSGDRTRLDLPSPPEPPMSGG